MVLGRERRAGAGDADDRAAHGRPEQPEGERAHDLVERVGLHELPFGHELRHDRVERGPEQRLAAAVDGDQHDHVPEHERVRQRQGGQHRAAPQSARRRPPAAAGAAGSGRPARRRAAAAGPAAPSRRSRRSTAPPVRWRARRPARRSRRSRCRRRSATRSRRVHSRRKSGRLRRGRSSAARLTAASPGPGRPVAHPSAHIYSPRRAPVDRYQVAASVVLAAGSPRRCCCCPCLPPPVVTATAATAPFALCGSCHARARATRASASWSTWAYLATYKMPYDDPAALERRVRVEYPVCIDRARARHHADAAPPARAWHGPGASARGRRCWSGCIGRGSCSRTGPPSTCCFVIASATCAARR